MKVRILKFLESEHISPAEFADKIGVQRSSMSHILNGRNHPSAAFIQKMLQAFPMVNSRWLLIGEGSMNLSSGGITINENKEKNVNKDASGASPAENLSLGRGTGNQMDIQFEQPVNNKEEALNESVLETEKLKSENQSLSNQISTTNLPDEKEIEQILFFYKDKTFRIYRPS